jgi:DNA-binding CsgD family transcriptional regulator
MTRTSGGRGGLCAIEGAAGIGKTRLLTHARQRATASGWRVIDTRCTPMTPSISYALLRDWFGAIAHRDGPGTTADGPGRALAELSDDVQRGVGDLVYGARWILEDLGQNQPVLLVVDDLQWGDVGSIEALDLLISTIQHLPCLVLYAVRTGEPVAAAEALDRVRMSSSVLTPAPLSPDAVLALLRQSDPSASAADAARIHDLTGGVPFFVRELLADADAVPDLVVGSIAGRLNRLSETAASTARAVCVLAEAATVGTVAELSRQQLDVVGRDISALVGAHLLSLDSGRRLAATHPLIARAVLAHLTSSESADLHGRAASILIRRGAPRAVVAGHLLHTMPGTDDDVRERLAEHGQVALRSGDHDLAVRYFNRAIAEGPVGTDQIPLFSSAALAHARAGDVDTALMVWEMAADLTDDPNVLATLKAEVGDALVMAGRHQEAAEAFGSFLDAKETTCPARQRLVARMVLAGMLHGAHASDLRQQVERVLAQPAGDDTYDDRLAMASGSVLLSFAGQDADRARTLARRAAAEGRLLDDENAEGTGLYLAAGALTWTSAFEESERLLTQAIERARGRSTTSFASASTCRGFARVYMGMVTEAVADFEAALSQRGQGWNAYLPGVLPGLVECRIARGELDLAAAHRQELESVAHHPGMTGAYATWALADLAEANGEHDQAAALYAEVGHLVADRIDNPAILPWRSGQALALIRLGRAHEAVGLARENAALARRFGAPYAVALALRTLAAVDPTGDRMALLREAMAALQGTRALRLEAQIATDLAGMMVLLTPGQGAEEAVRLLRQAESHANHQELRPLADRVHRLLGRLGQDVQPATAPGVNKLTVSERRVAELAASGMSNREIASQLFVTVKAVEWHLSNVYRKLGIRSRTRLTESLSSPAVVAIGAASLLLR